MRWQDCYSGSEIDQLSDAYRARGFANDDAGWDVLSDLIQRLIVASLSAPFRGESAPLASPGQIFAYWDEVQPPEDVRECMDSWRASDLHVVTYDRAAADDFLEFEFGGDVLAAFRYAHHPAMQADLFRLARISRLGGLYVDADDAFRGPEFGPIRIRSGAAVKSLAVCRHCPASVPIAVSSTRSPDPMNWYYLGNAPIAGVNGHPLFERALERSVAAVMTRKARGVLANIHADTGPSNFSFAALDYAFDCFSRDAECDLSVDPDWGFMEQSRWLQYKHTGRNWRTNSVIYASAAQALTAADNAEQAGQIAAGQSG